MLHDDRDLAQKAAAGDRQAFAELAERHRRLIYAVAWRVLLHEDDALDVTQEVLIKLARVIGQYRGEGNFTGWLSTLAMREALNATRRPGRRERPVAPEIAESLADLAQENHPEARVRLEREERLAMVHGAMAELQPQQRAILALRLGEDLSSAEVAERLGLPAAQVRSQLARAIGFLRQRLAPRNGEDHERRTDATTATTPSDPSRTDDRGVPERRPPSRIA